MIGSHVLKTYPRQQKTVALSSAEAELHAMVAASAEALGVLSLLKDIGMEAGGEVYSDSSAALGIAQWQDMGRVRHIRTQALWIQETRIEGRLSYKKVLGTRSPSDLLTKHMPGPLITQHLKTLGAVAQDGRAEVAPTLDRVQPYTEGLWLKRTRFDPLIRYKVIERQGKGRPTRECGKMRRIHGNEVKVAGDKLNAKHREERQPRGRGEDRREDVEPCQQGEARAHPGNRHLRDWDDHRLRELGRAWQVDVRGLRDAEGGAGAREERDVGATSKARRSSGQRTIC